MQQRDGLAIVFYPTSPSRKLLQFHTWITEYDLKYHHSFTDTIPTASFATISSSQKTQEERIGKDGFSKVPHELMMIIMDNLEATDILSLSMVNKKLRAHTQDNYLWRQILIRNYGESVIKDEPKHTSRRLKWKRTKRNKQPQVEPNWQKKVLTNITEQQLLKSRRKLQFREESPIEMTISNVPPGVYDIIWRMRIDKFLCRPVLTFATDIWLRHDIYLNSYERESKFKFSPDPDKLQEVFDKGWFHIRLPYKITIAKKDQFDDRRYQVHTGISCYAEDLPKSKSSKGPFSVDYVCLRPHIPYDHVENPPIIEHLENDYESLYSDNEYYDYDARNVNDENFIISSKRKKKLIKFLSCSAGNMNSNKDSRLYGSVSAYTTIENENRHRNTL
ncbi:14010_t:CDS:2 [Dentiscutata erythropus]|uniref:14010_t:CDS:1 n=1 Tax=Dentiscutata erythropus TaxID=1348616 RepID=A0A9N9IIN1_9GLOM|nr:14010_t:CDS:2 [Dentiscutata erythropus]